MRQGRHVNHVSCGTVWTPLWKWSINGRCSMISIWRNLLEHSPVSPFLSDMFPQSRTSLRHTPTGSLILHWNVYWIYSWIRVSSIGGSSFWMGSSGTTSGLTWQIAALNLMAIELWTYGMEWVMGFHFFSTAGFFSLPSVAKAKQMSLVTWHGTVVRYLSHWLNNICANERWRGIEFRNI